MQRRSVARDHAVVLGRFWQQNTDRSRELAAKIVRGDDEVFKLFTEMAHRYQFRQGGYTRIIRSRVRLIDAAQLAYIESNVFPLPLSRHPRSLGSSIASVNCVPLDRLYNRSCRDQPRLWQS